VQMHHLVQARSHNKNVDAGKGTPDKAQALSHKALVQNACWRTPTRSPDTNEEP